MAGYLAETKMSGGSMQLETDRTTAYVLEQWGIWSKDRTNIGYSKVSPMWIGRLKPSQSIDPDITDAEAVMIDSLLSRLESKDSVMGQVTIYFYRYGCNITNTAEKFNLNRKRIDVLVSSGTAWIDACLEMKRAA